MTKIKAIIFDIGGVIYRAGNGPPLREKWATKCGLDPNTFDQIVFNTPEYSKAASGEISNDQLWQIRNNQLKLSHADLQDLQVESWGGRWDQALMAYIQTLAPHYKLGIISDATSDARERVQEFIDLSLFDDVLFSYEAGICKPAPEIYRKSLARLGVAAETAVFIDDRQKMVDGAIAVGMQAYLYTEFAPFKEFMSTITEEL